MSYWENITSHHTQPDRTFLGTSEKRHRAAIGAARREPWYGGSCPSGIASSVPRAAGARTKKAPAPDARARRFADAVRYGYAGARKERAYRQFPNAAPARTYGPDAPAFMGRRATVRDEWTPPLRGLAPRPGGVALATPRLWPENAQYVSGFKARHAAQRPTSAWYVGQTTVEATADRDLHELDDADAPWLSDKVKRVQHLERVEVRAGQE